MVLVFVDLTVLWKRQIRNESTEVKCRTLHIKIIIEVVGVGPFGIIF